MLSTEEGGQGSREDDRAGAEPAVEPGATVEGRASAAEQVEVDVDGPADGEADDYSDWTSDWSDEDSDEDAGVAEVDPGTGQGGPDPPDRPGPGPQGGVQDKPPDKPPVAVPEAAKTGPGHADGGTGDEDTVMTVEAAALGAGVEEGAQAVAPTGQPTAPGEATAPGPLTGTARGTATAPPATPTCSKVNTDQQRDVDVDVDEEGCEGQGQPPLTETGQAAPMETELPARGRSLSPDKGAEQKGSPVRSRSVSVESVSSYASGSSGSSYSDWGSSAASSMEGSVDFPSDEEMALQVRFSLPLLSRPSK